MNHSRTVKTESESDEILNGEGSRGGETAAAMTEAEKVMSVGGFRGQKRELLQAEMDDDWRR